MGVDFSGNPSNGEFEKFGAVMVRKNEEFRFQKRGILCSKTRDFAFQMMNSAGYGTAVGPGGGGTRCGGVFNAFLMRFYAFLCVFDAFLMRFDAFLMCF